MPQFTFLRVSKNVSKKNRKSFYCMCIFYCEWNINWHLWTGMHCLHTEHMAMSCYLKKNITNIFRFKKMVKVRTG